MTAILGISAFYHDSAAALVVDGEIVAAAQEERFTRHKHDPGFPANAIAYCLAEAGITAEGLDFIAFYDKPLTKFDRLLETYLAYAPSGFKVNSGEYKLMGLAPYGRPVYYETIRKQLVDLKPDGSLWMNMDYFNYCQGLTMTNGRFHNLFGGPPRNPESNLEQRHMDLAASIQRVTEEAYRCFAATDMDVLVLEDYLLQKEKLPRGLTEAEKAKYMAQFALD